jgi:signal transduction histidine kinase/DNA-binding response OmpR family regulator
VGTDIGGVNRINKQTGIVTHYKNDPTNDNSLSYNQIAVIYGDRQKNIWIVNWGYGLNMLDVRSETFIRYNHEESDPTSISHNEIYSIFEDSFVDLWIGTVGGGLNRFNRTDKKFERFTHNPEDHSSLSNDIISIIFEDKEKSLWIGTNGGLNYFNRSKDTFSHYKRDEGLPNEVICGALEDDHDNLWLSTNNGIIVFNKKSKSFRVYDMRDGLLQNEFNQTVYFKNRSGEMYFGGSKGINYFHPDELKINDKIPDIRITGIEISNKPVPIGKSILDNRVILKKSITETNKLELTHDDNVLSLEFSSLDYSIPTKNKYAYILEGFDSDWTYHSYERRYATYTNLDPGEYIFRIKGSNNDGVWNDEGASLSIIIYPPWWLSSWAYLSYIILLLVVIYTTWKLQVKRIHIKHDFEMSKFEAQKLHEVDEIKSRFFANISHEFRTPLTLILSPVQELIKKAKDNKAIDQLSTINRNADRLLSLVNQLLDISKIESGNMKLEVEELNVVPIVKGLFSSFTSFADRKGLTMKCNCGLENSNLFIDKDMFEKILTNILSNAFKFTPKGGKITVSMKKTEEHFLLMVSDTGIGIPSDRISNIFDRFYQVDGSHTREQEGTGIGLALTKELIEAHKGIIKVESEENIGTTFTISFRLGREHFTDEEMAESLEEKSEHPSLPKMQLDSDIETTSEDIELLAEAQKLIILIVEDNYDVRKYILGILESEYLVVESKNGEEGMIKSFEIIPDLIVSDVMMPRMDGFEICEKLKLDERTSHIPIILLTAKATNMDKIIGFETGADDYLMKPFDANLLCVRIKNLLTQRERIKEHFKKEGIFELEGKNIVSVDKMFLKKAADYINVNISIPDLNVDMLAEELTLSRSQLHRKLVGLIGDSPGDLIRRIRMTHAAKLIQKNFGNISEVALEVGYNNPANFSSSFKKQFGISPKEYLQKNHP